MLKVYTATEGTEGMAMVLCLFVISQMPLYKYDTRLRLLMPLPRSGAADGATVVIGALKSSFLFSGLEQQMGQRW